MAIMNPTLTDFKNAQKRALDYQQYRSTADILRATAEFYKVSVFRSADDKPLYCVTAGLETSINVTEDKIQLTVSRGSAIVDNQPITFTDDFVFEYDKPSTDTTYYVYLRYKYVEEYPPNHAMIEIYTNQVDDEGFNLLAQIDFQVETGEAAVQDFTSEDKLNLSGSDLASKTGDSTLTFKVADAVEDDDAVNKRQLLEMKEACDNTDKILASRANEIESSLIDLKETVKSITDVNNAVDNTLSSVDDNIILDKIKNVDGAGSGLDADLINGKKLLATVNSDGSFNDDGIFKIKEVDGKKTLLGVLDADIEFTSAPPAANSFDIFGDGSRIALFEFENNVNDTGGVYNGTPTNITYTAGKFGQAAVFNGGSHIEVGNIFTSPSIVTVAFWVKWNGVDNIHPFSFGSYSLWFKNGHLAFNNCNSLQLGISSTGFKDTWKFVVAEFHHGDAAANKLWIDAISQSLTKYSGEYRSSNEDLTAPFRFGYSRCDNRFQGSIDHVSIFNRALTDAEVKKLYNEGA